MSKILLVEDTITLASEIADLLAMENHELVIAKDGGEAIEVLDRICPDLIISDLLMPKMDGFELLSRLKGDHTLKNIPVIIMTARTGEKVCTEALALGADRIVIKPCRARHLIENINELLKPNV